MAAGDLIIWVSVLLGLAIMLPSMVGMQHQAFTDQVAKVAAGQLANITNAALQYEYGYMASLSAPGSTHTVTVAQLIADNYLTAGTSAVDPMGNTISVRFTADSSGNVTGYVNDQGAYRYPDVDAGAILLALGDRGGYVPEVPLPGQTAGVIYGTAGTWQHPAPAGITPGSIDVEVEPNAAQQADDSRFLWRVPAPIPADNSMSTPLIMSAVEPPGGACANTGAIAQDGTGALVSCQGGTWQSVGGGHWRAPVATYGALPSSGNQNGDVRLTLDTDRAFAWSGSSWQALAVDQNGNLTVPNQLSAENGQINTSIGCDGHAQMAIGEISAISAPTCGTSAVGFDLGNTATGTDTTVFNQDGLQIWNYRYGTMFHVGYHGTANGPNYVLYGQQNGYGNWGFNNNANNGWGMVDTDGGGMNATPGDFHASVNANDYYDRASGEWFSQVASQVSNLTSEYSSLSNQVASDGNRISSNTSSIDTTNNRLNQGPCSTGYNSISQLCQEVQQFGAANMGRLIATGTQGPTTYTYWTYCGSRYYRYRCQQTGEGPPTVNLTASSAPELVFASASAGIGQGGCGSSANTGQITLSATSGGAPVDSQSGRYGKGGSNYNPNAMYFPFGLTFTLPAGQSGQIQLSGGENGLGCGSIQYAVYQL